MSTDRQQDAGLDRLLRSVLKTDAPVSGEVCPGADMVAAYAEGGLTERERIELEPHLAACVRCQSVLAMMTQDTIGHADSKTARVPAWLAWFTVPRLRWLVPAGAAAFAIAFYVAVKPESGDVGDQRQLTPVAAPAPAFTVAQQLNHGGPTPRENDAQPTASAGRVLPQAAEEAARRPAEAMSVERPTGLREVLPGRRAQGIAPGLAMPAVIQPSAATDLRDRADVAAPSAMAPQPPALAEKTATTAPLAAGVAGAPSSLERSALAEAAPPSNAPGSSTRAEVGNRAAVGGLAAVAVAERRARQDAGAETEGGAARARAKGAVSDKRVVTVEADDAAARYDVESLWKEAEFVVRARASAVHPAALVRQWVAPNLDAVEPVVSTDFDVVEVFKRIDSVIPTPQFVMVQVGSDAEDDATIYRVPKLSWVRVASGSDYVLFLARSRHPATAMAVTPFAGPWGVYRLQGDVVVIGNGDGPVPPPSTSALLAQLRRLAGTARR